MDIREPTVSLIAKPFEFDRDAWSAFLRQAKDGVYVRVAALADVARGNPRSALFFAGVVFFSFAVSLFLLSFPPSSRAALAQTPITSQGAVAAPESAPLLELHVANNGLVLLRGARIAAIRGTTITAHAAWGSTGFTWVVRTNATRFETRDFGTRFLTRDGKKISLGDFSVGEVVTITGYLDSGSPTPTLDADVVRSAR